MSKIISDIKWFSVDANYVVDARLLGVPIAIDKIVLVSYSDSLDAHPDRDPIGVFNYAGSKRFLWRDNYWSVYDLDIRAAFHKLRTTGATTLATQQEINKLMDILLVQLYGSHKYYCLYKINWSGVACNK